MANAKWYESSLKNGQLSLTIKGLITALVPAIMFIAETYKLPLTQEALWEFVNVILTFISSAMIFYGLFRKALAWVNKL